MNEDATRRLSNNFVSRNTGIATTYPKNLGGMASLYFVEEVRLLDIYPF